MPGDQKPDGLETVLEELIGKRVILFSIALPQPIEGVLNRGPAHGIWKHSLQASGGESAKDFFVRTEGILAVALSKVPEDGEVSNTVHLS